MRSHTLLAVAAVLALASVAGAASIGKVSGAHFTLNLLGKDSIMPDATGGPGGSRIFVPLHGVCRIDLTESEDFAVEDGNCTDDARSEFSLPDPDPEDDGVSSYRVYVRALGKPGGSAETTTCREDQDGTWCSTEKVYTARAAGRSPPVDNSRALLTVCHDRDGDGVYEREQIFDDDNAEYFWKYDNHGLRLAQLRFYPDTPTDISGPCPGA